jgi:Zn-finger protein
MIRITVEDIAKLANITPDGVRSLLYRSKLKIKQEYLEGVIDLIIHLRLKHIYNVTGHSKKFFENRSCKHYPCHKELKQINCLFCYCPLHYKCSSKQCKTCTFIHDAKNYDVVLRILQEDSADAKTKLEAFRKTA